MTLDDRSAPGAPGPRWRRRRSLAVGLLTAAIWFLLDQQTKYLAVAQLQPPGRKVELPGPLTWQLTLNDGGAFGLPAPRWFFLVVTAVVVVWVLRTLPDVISDLQAMAFGFLLAGATGNAADRLFRDDQRVVDFIASDRWPTFNVADIAISIGFVLLVTQLLTEDRRQGTA
ncbi:MAG TPA: signal peptidase II [Nitriliruptorales bacterium]